MRAAAAAGRAAAGTPAAAAPAASSRMSAQYTSPAEIIITSLRITDNATLNPVQERAELKGFQGSVDDDFI